MDFKNCNQCGKIFLAEKNEDMCPQCIKKNEISFYRVREYLRKEPEADMKQISEDCDVSMNLIKSWVKRELIEIANQENEDGPKCARCKTPIRTGRYCVKCKKALLAEINNVLRADA